MSDLPLDDVIAMAGGVVTPDTCPAVVPPDHFVEVAATIDSLGRHFEAIGERAGHPVGGVIALTMSSSFACKVRRLANGGHVLLVPLGMPARLRVLARLLLRYWGRERGVRFIRSALDRVQGDAEAVPPGLQPLLLEDFDPDGFWDALGALDASLGELPTVEADVRELVHLALVYSLAHEFTHQLHGHFALLDRARADPLDLSAEQLRRGLELDADDGAAAISMLILQTDVERALAAGGAADMDLGWLRLAYAVTMLFAISDTHRKFFGAFDRGGYNHPMVRCELFLESVDRCLDAPAAVRDRWIANSTEGWSRCVRALEDMNLDALSGAFGNLPPGVAAVPLHSLLYSATPGGVTDRATLDLSREGVDLMRRIRTLLPIFGREGGSA